MNRKTTGDFAVTRKLRVCVLMLMQVASSGCGGTKPVSGGTEGALHAGSDKLSDIQVTVYQVEAGASKPIGFGVSGTNGSFQLVTNEAKGPLRLTPGEYRCTLESVGSPVAIPKEYAKPETTPLKTSWSASQKSLDLEVKISISTR